MRSFLIFCRSLLGRWTWQMAWRDSRRQRQRLLLYSTSIVLGVAALVAVGSFGENLQEAVESQSKTLLGADLAIISNARLTEEEERFLASLGGTQAREISFSSMVAFPRTGSTRLVQVRAVEGAFPFYGTLDTAPKTAAAQFRSGSGALVEESLMKQFGLIPGDQVKVGGSVFEIFGSLQKVPGEMAAFSSFAPRVYVGLAALAQSELLQKGSLVRYKVFFRFGPEVRVPQLVKRIRPSLDKFHFEVDTVEHRKRELGRAMTNLNHFLNLVGFVALLLGGVGIASAIHVHVKEKLSTVAILRSLGCSAPQALAIYVAQAIGLGLIGVVAGATLGFALQTALPLVLADFVPIQLPAAVSWPAVIRGAGLGFAICLLFAWLPLMSVRRVPPLAALRASVEPSVSSRPDPLRWASGAIIAAVLIAFSVTQSQNWKYGLGFALALGLAFGVLASFAKLITMLVKRQIRLVGSFVWRQGLGSLYRPNNRTVLLMLSLGLGTFLILTLYLVQTNLIHAILPGTHDRRADAVLFDVQPDQQAGLVALLTARGFPVLEDVPVVTMRLAAVKGEPVEHIRKDPRKSIPNWVLRREYRSTYRAALVDSEKLIAGRLEDRVGPDISPVPVSVEEGIAKSLNVRLGDELVFDVQGVPVKTVVGSLREVDWRRMQPNFFFLFPLGVLEEAPTFHVVMTHVGSSQRSAEMQQAVVAQFPNVSTIDLMLVLQTVDSILRKISFVVRFMALFTVGTGVMVLVASLLSGRFQRLQESILLRTLGASRAQIQRILIVEYLCLGTMAAATGILLAGAGSWALAAFVFKIQYHISLLPLVVALVSVASLTVVVGLLTSRGICNQPPLEILRKEV